MVCKTHTLHPLKVAPKLVVVIKILIRTHFKMDIVIQIGTFHPEKPCLWMPVLQGGGTSVAEVKAAIASELHLLKESLQLFGLYQGGTLTTPKRLLQNDSILAPMEGDEMFFFKRLSFHKKEEEDALKRDYRGLELLWFEVDGLLSQPGASPGISLSQLGTIRDMLDKGKNSTPGSERKKYMLCALRFLSNECEPYYWELYYRCERCTLKEPAISTVCPTVTEGSRVQIALGSRGISFLSPCGHAQHNNAVLTKFRWNEVRSISADRHRCLITLEMLVQNRLENTYRSISFQTSEYEFVFSIVFHVLSQQD